MRSRPLQTVRRCTRRSKGSRLVVLENAGHVSNLEQTEQFNHALLDFLRESSTKLMAAHKKFTIEERVRWGDVDAARIIFYGAYIHFFEYAETELFREVGLHYGMMFDELEDLAAARASRVRLSSVARLDDLLEVSVYVGRFGTKSMRLNFEVRRKGNEELVATAHFVLAAVNQDTFETVPIPSELREKLAPYTANEDRHEYSNDELEGLDEKLIDRDPIKQFQTLVRTMRSRRNCLA